MKKLFLFLLTILLTFLSLTSADANKSGPKISGLSFISYQVDYDENWENTANYFSIKRAYITLNGNVSGNLSYRTTIDIYDNGNGYEYRLKYVYGSYKIGNLGNTFTSNKIDFGIIKTPLLGYQSTINHYRMIDKMFLDKYKILKSADLGVRIHGNFGGDIGRDYQNEVSSKYKGKYGTYSLGVYNGGGNSHVEPHFNVVYQGRLSLRPFGDVLPNFLVSGFAAIGKINVDIEDPMFEKQWNAINATVSWQNSRFNILAEYNFGSGDRDNQFLNSARNATEEWSGYSFFAEYKFLTNWRFISRYDYLDKYISNIDTDYQVITAGLGYDFYKENILMFTFGVDKHNDITNEIIMTTLQLKY